MNDLLRGELVYLTAETPDVLAKNFASWNLDTEWERLLDSDPPKLLSAKKWQEWLEKGLEKSDSDEFLWAIHRLEDDSLIGFIGLFNLYLQHGDSMVAIAVGDRKHWGHRYGTDAMRVMLRYSFLELNLRRVGLIVFEYNPRAIRSYEKAGFINEGRVRGAMQRDGRRWDFLYMGILRNEWLENAVLIRN
jgi:RimJ/RimL family protein N-acetyltransferase